MADQADGSIIIDTEINSDGFKAGSAELLAAIKALSTEVKNLGQTLKELFSKPLTPEINTGGAEDKVAALEAKVQELQASLEELQNTNGSGTPAPETTTPQVNIGGVTEKASGLQREIDAVNSSVQKLEPTFQKAMSGSESAMTSFEGKASTLESKIAELQERLDAVGQTQFPTQEYQSLVDALEKASYKADALRERMKTLDARGVSHNSQQWKNLQIDIDRAAQKCDTYAEAVRRMEADGSAFRMGADTAQYDQMQAVLASASESLSEMQSKTQKSESLMRRFASAAKSAAKTIAGSLVSGIRAAASGMAKMLFHSKKMNSQFGGLISGAKKFALSLLGARGVWALLRKAVSAYMAENQQLSNTLSACWSGIGNLLGPIITRIINLVAQAVAYVTAFLKLFGIYGKTASKEISSAGGAASKATDKLKRQLAAFDELNILSDNSSDGGGGGGGAGDLGSLPDVTLPDWAKLMVEQIKAGDWAAAANTLAAKLNEMVDTVDWVGIGDKIGYYLNGALTFLATFIQNFDWKNLASRFAELLNHIITGVDWGNLGVILTGKWAIILKSLDGFFGTLDGAAVSKAITDFMYGTVNAADWIGIAGSLAKNISNFISDIDFSALAEALSTQIRTALQSMVAAVENFDWAMLGRKIADFLNGIDWSGIFSDLTKLLGGLLIGALNLLVGFVDQVDWTGLADEIWACLESLTTDIDWDGFGELLGKFISGAITGVLDLITSLFSDHDWGEMVQNLIGSLGEALGAVIENIDWLGLLESLATALVSIIVQIPSIIVGAIGGIPDLLASLFEAIGLDSIAGFFRGIGDAMRDAGSWLKAHVVDPVVNWVKNLFGIHSPSTVFAEIGTFLIDGLKQGISNAWHKITDFFSGVIEKLKTFFSNAWSSIKSTATTAWAGIKGVISSAWNGIKSGVSSACNTVKTGISNAWSAIKSGTTSAWNGIKSGLSSAWTSIKTTASSTWTNLKTTVSNGWNNIKANTSTVWNGVKATLSSTWSNIKSTASSTWNSMKTTASSAWNSMKSTASSTWSNIKSSLSSTWSSIKSAASSTWSGIKNAIQNQGWSGVGSNICNGIANGISSGWSWLKNKVSSLASSLLSAAKSALGIHSPSRLFRDEIGLNIGYGVGEGVEASQPSILKSVSGVADAIADEFNAGDYKVGNIVPTSEVDGALSSFSDKISGSFTSLLDRLQAIADNITFAVPAVAGGVVPYKAAAAAASGGSADIGTTIETSNDALASVVTQVVTNATAAIVTAIQNYSGTTVNFDKTAIAESTIREINRRTRATGKSPLE